MFTCESCGEEFNDSEESEWHHICINCREDEEIAELLATDII